MAYAEILVHLDYMTGSPQRVTAALAMAKRTNAHVKGIALALQSTMNSYLGITLNSSFDKTQKNEVELAAEKLVADFDKSAKEAGVEATSLIVRTSATQAPAHLAFHARHADISIMGQPDPDHDSVPFIEALYEGVLFGSGRPVYLVPHFGRVDVKARNAVIAWDGGKKAARAVRDSIPLLQGRGKTTVLVINPEKRAGAHGENPGHDVAAYLRRHDIDVQVQRISNDEISTDTHILNYLAENGADLLVMGAYGHSRLREKAFGGVTNAIVNQMTTPVLMSD